VRWASCWFDSCGGESGVGGGNRDLQVPRTLSLHEMDINKMLEELRAEREHVEEAIIVLERLARGQGKRRGRPPAWMTTVKRRGRPPGSKNKPKTGGS
jgi:hypothetical protein